MTPHTPTAAELSNRRLVASAGFLGTAVEFYDFLLYAMAAGVVFPIIFFPEGDKFVGTLVSFAGLAVGYFARPIGGLLFGHFGDKYGRKNTVIITITGMGVCSMLMGLIPGYASIGVAAPVILVALRLIQGIALGGEYGGASLLAIENGDQRRRGWSGALIIAGGPTGAVLGNLALALFALPHGGLVAGLGGWAWRIPFLLSGVLALLGLILRLRIFDSPEYRGNAEAAKTAPKFPLAEILVHYPKETIAGILGGLSPSFTQGIVVSWFVTYAVTLGYAQSGVLLVSMVGNFVSIFGMMAAGRLSDRYGRKAVLGSAMIASIVLIWPIFICAQTGSWIGLFIGVLIGCGILLSATIGPYTTWLGEKFPANARFTGVSLSYQTASSLGAGIAPLVAATLVHAAGGSPVWVIVVVIGLSVVSGLAVFLSRDHHKVEALPVTRENDLTVSGPASATAPADIAIG